MHRNDGSEITFFLALLHGRLGRLVVEARRAAFGDCRRRGFSDDLGDRIGIGLDRRRTGDVADGAKAHADGLGLLARLQRLLDARVLTRFGPMFQIERLGGRFVLAALAVPEERFDEVTALVNALPEIAHNYRREHHLNMWFVLATETPEGIDAATRRIEADTGLPVFAFPKLREFFVDMRLKA